MNPNYPPYPSMPGAQPYPPYPTTTSQTHSTMPSPYASQPGFNMSGYPPQPQPAGIPPQSGGYPPQTGNYPPQSGGYSPQAGSYPPQSGGYAPQTGGYFPQSGGYSPQTGSYPPQTGSYPPQPQTAGYPSQTGNYPQAQSVYPPQKPSPYPLSSSFAPQAGYPQSQPAYHSGNNQHNPQTYAPAYAHTGIQQSGGHQFQEQLCPTVRPITPFDPRQDAEILRKAMVRLGTDEKAIIGVVTKRSNSQRQEIAVQFKAMYGKDLLSDLKSELSGKFENLVIALMTPLPVFLARELQYAIEGIGTNEETLIEVLCTASNAEIFAIKNAYTQVYGRSLENDLCDDTSRHFKRLLVSIVQGRRSEDGRVDEGAAVRDAQALMAAGVMMFGTDESTFNAILCTRSYPQLRQVLTEYQRLSDNTLEDAIRSEFSGDIKEGLLAIVQCAVDKSGYFAGRLRDAVACVGTKDRQLIRVVVSRCEIDMQNIKRAYQQRYGKSVEQDIADDTSGDYKKALLALVSGY